MREFVILFIGMLIVLSCEQKSSRLNASRTDSIADKTTVDVLEPKICLESFTEIPKEIECCSCSYSASEEGYQHNEYLFVCGFDSTAFVSVEGQLLKLKLVSTGREPITFGDYDHIDVFESENYTITLDIKYKEDGEGEVWWNNGTITIEDKSGQSTKLNFFGSCGC